LLKARFVRKRERIASKSKAVCSQERESVGGSFNVIKESEKVRASERGGFLRSDFDR
jgi:hypothetical protein